MVVCHCNDIRDNEVRAVARECDGSVRDAYACLGCTVQCGSCVDYAESLLREATRELVAA